jgi:hypothetical protein
MRVCSDRRLREENVPERAGPVRPLGPPPKFNKTIVLPFGKSSLLARTKFFTGGEKAAAEASRFAIVSDGSPQRTGLKEKSTRGKTFPSRKRPQLPTLCFECDSVQKRQKKNPQKHANLLLSFPEGVPGQSNNVSQL